MQLGFTGSQTVDVDDVPQIRDAIQSGDTDALWRCLPKPLMQAAGLSAAHLTSDLRSKPFSFRGDKQSIGAYQAAVEKGNLDARNFEQANKDLIRNKPLDAAALMYHEAAGNTAKLETWRQDILSDDTISEVRKVRCSSQASSKSPGQREGAFQQAAHRLPRGLQRGQQSGIFDPD